jgi:hypothetical protein
MFTQTRIALAIVAAFAVAGAGSALAGDKKHEDTQSNSGATQSDGRHDDANAGAKSGEPHPADVPAQAEGAPGQAGTAPGEAGTTAGQSGTAPGQAATTGVTPGDQRQQQQGRPADMDGPTADDAAAGSDETRSN